MTSLVEKFRFNYTNELEITRKLNFNPYYQILCSGAGSISIINDEEFINLASNNYLGIANDMRVIDAMKASLDKYGASMCGTPVACGNSDLYELVEIDIPNFLF